jgi:hypothetical protein
MLNTKEIYERVSAHLLTQQAVSEDENGTCRLHGNNKRRCAIGSLIRDDVYRPEIEGVGISYYQNTCDGALLQALYASDVNIYDETIIELLTELEEVHDNANVEEWPALLTMIGRRHALI